MRHFIHLSVALLLFLVSGCDENELQPVFSFDQNGVPYLPHKDFLSERDFRNLVLGKAWYCSSSYDILANGWCEDPGLIDVGGGKPTYYFDDPDSVKTFFGGSATGRSWYEYVPYEITDPMGFIDDNLRIISAGKDEFTAIFLNDGDVGSKNASYNYCIFKREQDEDLERLNQKSREWPLNEQPPVFSFGQDGMPYLPEKDFLSGEDFRKYVLGKAWECNASYAILATGQCDEPHLEIGVRKPMYYFNNPDSVKCFLRSPEHNGRNWYIYSPYEITTPMGCIDNAFRIISADEDKFTAVWRNRRIEGNKDTRYSYCIFQQAIDEDLKYLNRVARRWTGE